MLTDAQRKLAEDNHNLIYFTLNKMKLSADDYYGAAAIGLCKAAETWDSGKSEFSTYSFYLMRNEILLEMRSARKDIRPSCSLDEPAKSRNRESVCIKDTVSAPDMIEPLENRLTIISSISKANRSMSNKEKRVFAHMLAGHKQQEIANDIGNSQPHVSRLITNIHKKFHECVL